MKNRIRAVVWKAELDQIYLAILDLYEFYEISIEDEIEWMIYNEALPIDYTVEYFLKNPDEK